MLRLKLTDTFRHRVSAFWHDKKMVYVLTLVLVQESFRSEGGTETHFSLSREQSLVAGHVITDFVNLSNIPAEFVGRLEHDFANAMCEMEQKINAVLSIKTLPRRADSHDAILRTG